MLWLIMPGDVTVVHASGIDGLGPEPHINQSLVPANMSFVLLTSPCLDGFTNACLEDAVWLLISMAPWRCTEAEYRREHVTEIQNTAATMTHDQRGMEPMSHAACNHALHWYHLHGSLYVSSAKHGCQQQRNLRDSKGFTGPLLYIDQCERQSCSAAPPSQWALP